MIPHFNNNLINVMEFTVPVDRHSAKKSATSCIFSGLQRNALSGCLETICMKLYNIYKVDPFGSQSSGLPISQASGLQDLWGSW